MKRVVPILFLFITLSACTNKNHITGNWIEKDNFVNPEICEIRQDFYRTLNGPILQDRLYKIKKDTFLFDNFMGLDKIRFKVAENELLFYDINSDSLLGKFERNIYKNFIDYFNVKKHTEIMLPVLKATDIERKENSSTIVFDIENDNAVYLNGEKFKLDSLTYLKLLPDIDDYLFGGGQNLVFCDGRIRLSVLNNLKSVLQKARRNRIIYVTQDSSDHLCGIQSVLPYTENNIPDSLLSKYPPLPPPLFSNPEDINEHAVICKISATGKEISGKPIKSEELDSVLKEKMMSTQGVIVDVYFDDRMDFETYLRELSKLRAVYQEESKKNSEELFLKFQQEDSEYEGQEDIRMIYPMLIHEIDRETYETLITQSW
ncbi:hypothetical protein ACE1ET_01195 [Saccharicrinis sp. FJH62]|uniref:hypothetical protein n=1 Tax=Saccharicrinis sp. FJH62 TaxID=3344657 RepID=UPI0035D50A4C